jgi:hypothetical protein
MMLEWPKGSGRSADYTDDERADVRAMIAAATAAGIPKTQTGREIEVLHDLKVELGARLLSKEVV